MPRCGIWPRIGKVFHDLAYELCGGRWRALGGGGYAIYEVVPRAWTRLFAEMVERPDLAEEVNDPNTVVPGPEAQGVWAALQKDLTRPARSMRWTFDQRRRLTKYRRNQTTRKAPTSAHAHHGLSGYGTHGK